MSARSAGHGRADPGAYAAIPLRAHTLLEDVPIHDVWYVDLPGSGPETSVLDLRELAGPDALRDAGLPVKALFALRTALGRLFGWDDGGAPGGSEGSWLPRVSDELRAASAIEPGERAGPFVTLFADDREAISEAMNRTVHAFLVFALSQPAADRRLYWAVYVRPGGRATRAYMALIDPFRRYIVYPAILRRISRGWGDRARNV